MAQKNRVDLTIQSAEIRDETVTGANTALRVGTLQVDLVDSFLNITDDVALYDQSGEADAVQGNLDTHTGDATIHFTEGSIDHTAITNIGTNTHAQIDTHISEVDTNITRIALYSATTTGTVPLDCSTFDSWARLLTGNTDFTFTNTPAAGETFVRNLQVKTTAGESLTFSTADQVIGTFVNDNTTWNLITINFANYPILGLFVTVIIS